MAEPKVAPASRARVRVGLCQMRVYPGEPARNAEALLRRLEEHRGRVDLLVFPEMCLPGYFVGDLWERPAFLRECETWSQRIAEATAHGPAAVFGTVAVDWNAKGEDGRPRKFNAFVAAAGGKAWEHPALGKPFGVKTLSPNYREFEEARHFYDTRKLAQEAGRPFSDYLEPVAFELGGGRFRFGVVLCEDAWEDDYAQKPMEVLARKRPDFVLNLSASPFTRGKNDKRHRVFGAKAKLLGAPLVYVNCVGLQNNAKTLFTFDGCSTVYGGDGAMLAEMEAFAEGVAVVELEQGRPLPAALPPSAPPPAAPFSLAEMHGALRYGAETFLASTGRRKVVVGISGGIDSAVAAALYREFLGPEELLLLNLPSRFNSATTRSLARELAQNLGCLFAEVSIEEGFALTQRQVHGLEAVAADGARVRLELEGLAAENVQARDRGSRILAAAAAAFGGVFSCNTNKAELTVGYGTLYGDLGGYLAVLGDLWKRDVYALGRHLNAEIYRRGVIPEGIFSVTPSAELSAEQDVDAGRGDPLIYPYHDRLFFAFVQRWNRASPEEILEWYLAGSLAQNLDLPADLDLAKLFPTPQAFLDDLERWWNLYNGLGVAKRVQAPPLLAVSSRAFGFDHRESLLAPAFTERYRVLKQTALAGTVAA